MPYEHVGNSIINRWQNGTKREIVTNQPRPVKFRDLPADGPICHVAVLGCVR